MTEQTLTPMEQSIMEGNLSFEEFAKVAFSDIQNVPKDIEEVLYETGRLAWTVCASQYEIKIKKMKEEIEASKHA